MDNDGVVGQLVEVGDGGEEDDGAGGDRDEAPVADRGEDGEERVGIMPDAQYLVSAEECERPATGGS